MSAKPAALGAKPVTPGAKPAAPGAKPAANAASPAAPQRGPAKRRSDTEMRTGKNAIAEPTEKGIDSGPATRAETDSDLAEPPPPVSTNAVPSAIASVRDRDDDADDDSDAVRPRGANGDDTDGGGDDTDAGRERDGDDTDAEARPFPNGAPPRQRISEAELAKLTAQASAPDPTAQTLLAPEVLRRDPQDLMATMERNPRLPAPRTPIPTLERKVSPVLEPGERPVQVPLSTAPASLPPPKDLDTNQSGPSPACPQCEAPMSWVDEHLRFYCRACRMYF